MYVTKGSAVCLTRDRAAAGSSLTGVTAVCPWARHINHSLVLVQPRKTRLYITERLLMGREESNQTKQTNVYNKRLHELSQHMKLLVPIALSSIQGSGEHVQIMGESRGGGGGSTPRPSEKSQKYRFLSNTSPEPLKTQTSIQCWASHNRLNGVSLAGR